MQHLPLICMQSHALTVACSRQYGTLLVLISDCLLSVVGTSLQVVDMPLLFETGTYKFTRPRVLVYCDQGTQVSGRPQPGRSAGCSASCTCVQLLWFDAKPLTIKTTTATLHHITTLRTPPDHQHVMCVLQQARRLISRSRCTPEHAVKRVAAQMPMDQKLRMADVIIDNNGTLEELQRQVHAGMCGYLLGGGGWPGERG